MSSVRCHKDTTWKSILSTWCNSCSCKLFEHIFQNESSSLGWCLVKSHFALNFQAFSIFMAMVLRALGPDNSIDYDSDDDFVPARLPLLRNEVQQTYQTAAHSLSLKIDSWIVSKPMRRWHALLLASEHSWYNSLLTFLNFRRGKWWRLVFDPKALRLSNKIFSSEPPH